MRPDAPRALSILVVLAATALVAACASQAGPVGGATPDGTPPGPHDGTRAAAWAGNALTAQPSTPTFYADVLPILQDNCQVCHIGQGLNLGGMVAPWPLTTYEEASGRAERIARAVESGSMPPWHAAEHHRGTFKNERLLAPEDARTLIAWARGGTPAGEPGDAPPPRDFPTSGTGWSIGEPDLIVSIPEYLVHDTIEDQYIDFNVTIDASMLPEDRWVKAVEFRAGSSAVHHVLAPPLGGIAPGVGPRVYPEGLGTVLRTGTTVRFNMHYHKHPGPGTAVIDQTQVALVFYEPGEVIEHVVEGDDLGMFRFSIPPNVPDYTFKSEYTFERDAKIVWLTPHMHLRGKSALYELTYPDGRKHTLLEVPAYDFSWQHTYNFADPVLVPAGTKVELTLTWDNSAANPHNPDPTRTVTWGLPTTDEMGYGFMSFIDVEPSRYVVGEPIPEELRGNR
jgi:hypothetical protein